MMTSSTMKPIFFVKNAVELLFIHYVILKIILPVSAIEPLIEGRKFFKLNIGKIMTTYSYKHNYWLYKGSIYLLI